MIRTQTNRKMTKKHLDYLNKKIKGNPFYKENKKLIDKLLKKCALSKFYDEDFADCLQIIEQNHNEALIINQKTEDKLEEEINKKEFLFSLADLIIKCLKDKKKDRELVDIITENTYYKEKYGWVMVNPYSPENVIEHKILEKLLDSSPKCKIRKKELSKILRIIKDELEAEMFENDAMKSYIEQTNHRMKLFHHLCCLLFCIKSNHLKKIN